MHITIAADLALGLDQPAQFTAFDILAANPDQSSVLDALGDDGQSCPETDHVFVSVAAVRRLAGPATDADWEAGFAKMLEFAASKGWMNNANDAVKAHIEPA